MKYVFEYSITDNFVFSIEEYTKIIVSMQGVIKWGNISLFSTLEEITISILN